MVNRCLFSHWEEDEEEYEPEPEFNCVECMDLGYTPDGLCRCSKVRTLEDIEEELLLTS